MTWQKSIEQARGMYWLKWGQASTVSGARNASTIHGPSGAVKAINDHDVTEADCHDRKLGRERTERAHGGQDDYAICHGYGSAKDRLIGRRCEKICDLGQEDHCVCPPQPVCEN